MGDRKLRSRCWRSFLVPFLMAARPSCCWGWLLVASVSFLANCGLDLPAWFDTKQSFGKGQLGSCPSHYGVQSLARPSIWLRRRVAIGWWGKTAGVPQRREKALNFQPQATDTNWLAGTLAPPEKGQIQCSSALAERRYSCFGEVLE